MNSWVSLLPDESSGPDNAVPLDVTRLLTTITDHLIGMICCCRVDATWTMALACDGFHKRLHPLGNIAGPARRPMPMCKKG